jgi:pimeloyl-ACP methyl ester carboxylesterase
VMLGTCVPMPVPDALLALAKTDVRAAIDRVVTFSFSSLAAKPSFPAPGAWLRGGGRQLMRMVADRSGDPLLFFKDFTACNTYRPAEGFAKALDCPVDLVVGDHDQMTLARAAVPLATASGATLHRIDAGHFMMQEAPVAVLEAIRQATQPARTRGVES